MTPSPTDRAAQIAATRSLARTRWRVAALLTLLMVGVYFGFILLVAYRPAMLAALLSEGLSLGILLGAAVPSLSQAQVALKTAVESGNAIVMYLCGVFAAIGIVTAGVSMMAGRPTIAKWSFAGAMVSGLGFAIVKTMWTAFGLTPADVSTF